ncbi:type VII toxin-antitoxin system HepT family RNase toxin [Kineococcus terrestris]|uniref:type VII toxin-antitoxin system HepT family RNase toxin n=1 Tax=Kineococcus terrestris TaxID=2044856 RepID=UPI0034DB77D7
MSPRELDLGVVHAELSLIAGSLDVLTSAGEVGEERLRADPLLTAAVERLVSRVVDLAVDVNAHVAATALGRAPADHRSSFGLAARAGALTEELAQELAPSAGLRDVLVHQYADLDLAVLAASVPRLLDGHRRCVGEVAACTATRGGG